jgi:hypothetical protein
MPEQSWEFSSIQANRTGLIRELVFFPLLPPTCPMFCHQLHGCYTPQQAFSGLQESFIHRPRGALGQRLCHVLNPWHVTSTRKALIKCLAEGTPVLRPVVNRTKLKVPLASPLLSCPVGACPSNLTGGDGRCQKKQQTEDKTCIKLGPGRLGALMETHQPLHLQWVYYIQLQHKVERWFSGERM